MSPRPRKQELSLEERFEIRFGYLKYSNEHTAQYGASGQLNNDDYDDFIAFIKQELREQALAITAEFKEASHGGGNWRRVLELIEEKYAKE